MFGRASLRSALCSIGLGDMLAPVNIFTIAGDTEAILLNETWKDVEFEVALDSGSVVSAPWTTCRGTSCRSHQAADEAKTS